MQTLTYLTYRQSKYKPTRKISLKNEDLNRQKIKQDYLGGEVKLPAKKRKTKINLKNRMKRENGMSKTNGELLLPSSPQGDRIRGTDKQKGTRTELVPEKWNLLNKLMTKDLGKTLTPENQYERDGTGLKTWDIYLIGKVGTRMGETSEDKCGQKYLGPMGKTFPMGWGPRGRTTKPGI